MRTTAIWIILTLWIVALTGCGGGEAEPKQNPKPIGKPERPLKHEHKDAYVAMVKQRSNARFPEMDASKFRSHFQGRVRNYKQMVEVFGAPDEIRVVNLDLSEKDVRPNSNNLRIAVYHNMVFNNGIVESYYFTTGETANATMPIQPLEESFVGFGGTVSGVYYNFE